jgi:hypothetical protein
MVLSAVAAVSLAGAGTVPVAVAGFAMLASMGGLALYVLYVDRQPDPCESLLYAADSFDQRWDAFERDFWAHVDEVGGASELD